MLSLLDHFITSKGLWAVATVTLVLSILAALDELTPLAFGLGLATVAAIAAAGVVDVDHDANSGHEIQCPERMRLGNPARATVTVHHIDREAGQDPFDTISMDLKFDDQTFRVVALNSQQQSLRDLGETRWDFEITPLRTGERRIRFLGSATHSSSKMAGFDVISYDHEVAVHRNTSFVIAELWDSNWRWFLTTMAIPIYTWLAYSSGAIGDVLQRLGIE